MSTQYLDKLQRRIHSFLQLLSPIEPLLRDLNTRPYEVPHRYWMYPTWRFANLHYYIMKNFLPEFGPNLLEYTHEKKKKYYS